MQTATLHDRILGCVLGGALGDAWGGPYEGAQPHEAPVFSPVGRLSDDTQMTLATCESIIKRNTVAPAHIAGSLLAWFETGRIHGLGASTMKALRNLQAGSPWESAGAKGERAAGNGAAMRVAPLAFLLDPIVTADRVLIRDVARITHHHDEAHVGALAVVVAIRLMVFGTWQPEEASLLDVVASLLPDSQVRDRLLRYRDLPTGTSPREVAEGWGSSGYVVESVPLALFAAQAIAQQSFETVMSEAVAAGGDADTVASIAGQVAGARVGVAALPAKLLARIEDIGGIHRVTEAFAATVERIRHQRGLAGLPLGGDDFDPSDEVKPRWESGTSIDKLSLRFDLKDEPWKQDWAVETADPDLIDRLLDNYADPTFTDDDRFTLMSLLVACLDKAKSKERDIDKQWAQTAELLRAHAPLHAYTMACWAQGEDPDPDHYFSITPEMRSLWAELRPACVEARD